MKLEDQLIFEKYLNRQLITEEDNTLNIDSGDINADTIQVYNVNRTDYPEFTDAYFGYAEFTDGTELDNVELEELNEKYPDLLNQLAHNQYISSNQY